MKRGYVFMTQTPLASMQAFRFSLPGTCPSLADKKPEGEPRHGKATSRTHALAFPPAGSVKGCQAWGTTKEKLSRILWPQRSKLVGRNYLDMQERQSAGKSDGRSSRLNGCFGSSRLPLFSELRLTFIAISTNTVQTLATRSMLPRSRRVSS